MATEKALKLGLEVDDTRAKAKIKNLASSGGSFALEGASDKAAKSLSAAAAGADKLSNASKMSADKLRSIATTFGGMGIRLATTFAASHMANGSAGQVAMQAGGGALAGALQGAIAGPLGALAGGIMGLTTELISANAQASESERARKEAIMATCAANREQLEAMWKAEERTDKFKSLIKELSSATDEATRRQLANLEIEKRKQQLSENDGQLHDATDHFWGGKDGGEKKFRSALAERATIKGELEQLKNLIDQKAPSPGGTPFRVSHSAADALGRIGGRFAETPMGEKQLRIANEQLTVLKKIESETRNKGGASWQ